MEIVKQNLPEVPTVEVSMSVPIAPERQIVFRTFVPQDMDRRDLDELMDRMIGAADRQRAKVELVDLYRHRSIQDATLKNTIADIAKAEAAAKMVPDNRRNAKPSNAQLGTIENLNKTAVTLKQELDRYEIEIAKRWRIVDGDGMACQEAAE